MKRLLLPIALCILCMTAANAQISVLPVFPSLTFERPVDMVPAPDGSNRIFIVEQKGRVRVFTNSQAADSAAIFLDIVDKVRSIGNEEGLLGLTFHPDYADNGYFFVYYSASNPRRSVISRFSVMDDDMNMADPSSEMVIMEVKQPFANHNAGQIRFGPDGYLYIALGDGGDGGDPFNNAQDRGVLLGKILRIDVDNKANGENYAIPPDNPFAGSPNLKQEIYAYGFRNPYRFSFDSKTGWLWASDAGQDALEEIDIVNKGGNYGWNIMEGGGCYEPLFQCDAMADSLNLIKPIWDYTHREGDVVIGGFVYRGTGIQGLEGHYVYGDFTAGKLWALSVDETDTTVRYNREIAVIDPPFGAMGVDVMGELHLLGFDGKLYRLSGTLQPQQPVGEELKVAFPNLQFTRPVDLQPSPDASNRLFVVEQAGAIRAFENRSTVGEATTFLDIRDRVRTVGNEEGLLGLAFHPKFDSNGFFYVNYVTSNPRRTRISRFTADTGVKGMADANSELILLEVGQPYANHNAGQIRFGPDGYLYIPLGDGGNAADPHRNAQDRQTLLGDMLRIDVDKPSGGRNYGIPADNPYVGNTEGWREEIYAYGFRNPYRFSFDPQTGWLWLSDAGQDKIEEINVVVKGGNYGWNIMEGSGCFYPKLRCDPLADSLGLMLPIWDYSHNIGDVVIGGAVYRGNAVPSLKGWYIYADFSRGQIFGLKFDEKDTSAVENRVVLDTDLLISGFGTDLNNELYIMAFDGKIYTFNSNTTSVRGPEKPIASAYGLGVYPNPARSRATVSYDLPDPSSIRLEMYDIDGRYVSTVDAGWRDAGTHTVSWESDPPAGTSLSSGMYTFRLTVDNRVVDDARIVVTR